MNKLHYPRLISVINAAELNFRRIKYKKYDKDNESCRRHFLSWILYYLEKYTNTKSNRKYGIRQYSNQSWMIQTMIEMKYGSFYKEKCLSDNELHDLVQQALDERKVEYYEKKL